MKKIFAVLLAFLIATDILPWNKLAYANKIDFINTYTSNSIVICAASNIEPSFNKVLDGFLKIIFKIVRSEDGTLNVSTKDLEIRKAILNKKIKFENDIRLFTLYAFMNYTGYGDDITYSGFTDVRNSIMEELGKKNLKLSDNKYYSNKEVQFSYYRNSLRDLGSVPYFEIIGIKSNIQNNLLDLPGSLNEFYKKADIEKLYDKYKPCYNNELSKIEDKSLTAIVVINNYLKIDNYDVPNIDVEINLLEPYGRSACFTLIDKYKGNAVITLGPSKEPDIQSVVHEYLHFIINPIINNLQSDVNKLSYMSKEIPAYSKSNLYYSDWSVNVEESIVKALEYRVLGGNRKASIKNAVNDGFILTQYFDERFDEFRNYRGSLNDFIKILLQNYYKTKK